MTKTTLFLIALISTFIFNKPESHSITIKKNNIMSKSPTPKGIALVWPEELPKASDGSNRDVLKDFYLQLLDKIPSEIEVTVIVKYENQKTKIKRELQNIYPDHNFKFIVISSIRDIWIRDWAPIMIMNNSKKYAIKANYKPYYLTKRESNPDNQAGLFLADEYNIDSINLIWDGGNFTHNDAGIGIITNRIVGDNEHYSLEEISKVIKKSLGLNKLIFVPVEPGDETGHVDGMVRFISSNIIAVSRYPKKFEEENEFLDKIVEIVKNELGKNFKIIRISNRAIDEESSEGIPSAVGNHMNFLILGEKVLIPIYSKADTIHIEELKEYFEPDNIITIDCNLLAKKGGVLNCITWTYY